ncbi:DUF3189 family protein [Fodinisporobacter ferrooxydans]|uniref:DUF3189 family protein n=1 Tax=Fodinisporobacter ferrooxydans TaxID=2901836 RepID=A0ABY4CGV1_9BACL|nr:DUF3189 family protein [Alicyclobacillaceae bacterium MYW30-H2]
MDAVVFYDNDFGFGAFLAAQMLTGACDFHNMPSFEQLRELSRRFRPSDGTIHVCGNISHAPTFVAYAGCHRQSHIAIKCLRNFVNLYRLDQTQYAFIRTPSISLAKPYRRSSIPIHKSGIALTRKLYATFARMFPHIQTAVCSVVWQNVPMFRARVSRNHEEEEPVGNTSNQTSDLHRLDGRHIVYHCYGSAHSSITSAAIHLNRLPNERRPHVNEIIALTDYDRSETWQIGTLNFKGYDTFGNAIYTIGLGADPYTVKRLLASFLERIGCDTSQLVMQEALVHINSLARIGGALSRRYGFVTLGRIVSAFAIQRQYERLVTFVNDVSNRYGGNKNKA